MNISYKLLLTAILLTALTNSSVFASDSEEEAESVESKQGVTPLSASVSDTQPKSDAMLVSRFDGLKTFAGKRSVQIGAAAVVVVVAAAVIVKHFSKETVVTVESLEAAIVTLNAEITVLQRDVANVKETAAKIIARKKLEAQLEALQAKEEADTLAS